MDGGLGGLGGFMGSGEVLGGDLWRLGRGLEGGLWGGVWVQVYEVWMGVWSSLWGLREALGGLGRT